MARHLTLKLDDSVTETHCNDCVSWHLAGPRAYCRFGDLKDDKQGPIRHPSCLANERDTGEVRGLAGRLLHLIADHLKGETWQCSYEEARDARSRLGL